MSEQLKNTASKADLDDNHVDQEAMQTNAAQPAKHSDSNSLWRRFYTSDFDFNFVGRWKTWVTISLVLLVLCVGSLAIRGLNLGVEFTGGSVFQAPVQVQSDTISRVNQAVTNSGVANLNMQTSTLGDSSVRVQTRSLDTDEVIQVRRAIADEVQVQPDDVTYTLIGPSWGKQITNRSLVALSVFIVLVFAMIWIFFRDWKMSLSAILALVHDIMVTVGLYALIGFSVTPATVIGFLTILGYSLYDTVVVFDKVKESTADLQKQNRTYGALANQAVNQVLVRSINTTVIAVLPVISIMIAGMVVLNGEGPLADLGLALLIGMITGAYSSLCIATPLLVKLRQSEPEIAAHDKAVLSGRFNKRKHAPAVEATSTRSSQTNAMALAPTGGADAYVSADAPAATARPKSAGTPATQPSAAGKRPVTDSAAGRPQPKNSSRSQRKK